MDVLSRISICSAFSVLVMALAGRPISAGVHPEALVASQVDELFHALLRSAAETNHQVFVDPGGRRVLKFDILTNGSHPEFLKTCYDAVRGGAVDVIDTGRIFPPKPLLLMMSLINNPPAKRLVIRGRMAPKDILAFVRKNMQTDGELRGRSQRRCEGYLRDRGYSFSAAEVRNVERVFARFNVREECHRLRRALPEDCDVLAFEVDCALGFDHMVWELPL